MCTTSAQIEAPSVDRELTTLKWLIPVYNMMLLLWLSWPLAGPAEGRRERLTGGPPRPSGRPPPVAPLPPLVQDEECGCWGGPSSSLLLFPSLLESPRSLGRHGLSGPAEGRREGRNAGFLRPRRDGALWPRLQRHAALKLVSSRPCQSRPYSRTSSPSSLKSGAAGAPSPPTAHIIKLPPLERCTRAVGGSAPSSLLSLGTLGWRREAVPSLADLSAPQASSSQRRRRGDVFVLRGGQPQAAAPRSVHHAVGGGCRAHRSCYVDPPSSRAWWPWQARAPWHELLCHGLPQAATGVELSKNARETTSCSRP